MKACMCEENPNTLVSHENSCTGEDCRNKDTDAQNMGLGISALFSTVRAYDTDEAESDIETGDRRSRRVMVDVKLCWFSLPRHDGSFEKSRTWHLSPLYQSPLGTTMRPKLHDQAILSFTKSKSHSSATAHFLCRHSMYSMRCSPHRDIAHPVIMY